MSDLLVPDIDEALINALRERAFRNGRSMVAEHRAILVDALTRPAKRSLAEVLAAMPDVGRDEDFASAQEAAKLLQPGVFD